MDGQAWVALGTLCFAVILSLVGMAVFLLGRIEAIRDDLHSRINTVKDTYLRRDDLSTHLKPLYDVVNSLRDDLHKIMDRLQK